MIIRPIVGSVSIFSLFFLMAISSSSTSYPQREDSPLLISGVASGDVRDKSAIIWSRTNREAQMHVEYDTAHNFSGPSLETAAANQTTDFIAKVKLQDLQADSNYFYRVWFTAQDSDSFTVSNPKSGSFRTAPNPSDSRQLDFVLGGDLGGQGFCRRVDMGYPIFSIMADLLPSFFLFNGDQIYADTDCPRSPPGSVIGWRNIQGNFINITDESVDWTNITQLHDIYLKHWEYNKNDTHLTKLLQNTPLYSQFDDHEVIDNYGGNWSHLPGEQEGRIGLDNLVKTGVNLWTNFSPVDLLRENGHFKFHRDFIWGKALHLFILDTRSYRSVSTQIDNSENNKTLLGKEQLEWLKQGLSGSNATWKLISTSNPLTIPTCTEFGCDGWATDGIDNRSFVRERSNLLNFLDHYNIQNVVFVATDVHFPANVVVNQDFDGDGEKLIFYELVSGPLSASPLMAHELDPTLNATFLYVEDSIFNFGHVSVKEDIGANKGYLVSRIIDINGIVRPNSVLKLTPQ